ncbi:Zn-dependent hydrolase [Candidatus Saccharibacteria bacterium oral taxon 488]|jgi:Zn-dependent hydrolase of the beta-lactamase fold-like protein|nr:Zn-dependent hydrolase [Candidatus Saccharibacteria bacterium oral taxon 488]QJU10693.1 Zn-dependent hydrolase [Candidatus Saccharibacteria bacterium oral taxon 488]QLF51580.1 MBL fold metallo-hydrolase [Candidatus Saccharibacteria bacterium oral taxon 488]
MFEVEYKGANNVIFTTKMVKIAFDPALSLVGLKDNLGGQDVEILSEDRFAASNVTPRLLFSGPGEYEVGDVSLKGVAAWRHIDTETDVKKSTIYRLAIGGVRVVIIGNVAPKLSESQLEEIGVVDVVVIPVGGGGYTLDATSAVHMVRQLEPKVVIPVHYADGALHYEVPQDDLSVFVSEMGVETVDAGPKWKVKGVASLPEQLSIIIVARS